MAITKVAFEVAVASLTLAVEADDAARIDGEVANLMVLSVEALSAGSAATMASARGGLERVYSSARVREHDLSERDDVVVGQLRALTIKAEGCRVPHTVLSEPPAMPE